MHALLSVDASISSPQKPLRRLSIASPSISDRRASLSSLYICGGSNALQLQGSIIAQVLAQHRSGECDHSLFDALEAVVFFELKLRWQRAFFASVEFQQYLQFSAFAKVPLREEDFFKLRTVGRGAFGEVVACRRATTGRLYALKIMSIKRIKSIDALASMKTERDLLLEVQSPYVVSCCYAFRTRADVMLVLDLMMGGDLSFHLKQQQSRCFTEEQSRYFAVRMALGIAALHAAQIVHRDLKPENVLMDATGRTKLSDLGLACKMHEQVECFSVMLLSPSLYQFKQRLLEN